MHLTSSSLPPLPITPLWHSLPLSLSLKKSIYLKMDNHFPSGSFKIRGIRNLTLHHLQNGAQHLVAASGGNAGFSTAYLANQLNLPATIFVPTTSNPLFIQKIQQLGAHVISHGSSFNDAEIKAKEFVHSSPHAAYIPPYDHPLIWQGHSSLIDELANQLPSPPDLIVASVGGGGLLCGILEGLHRHKWTNTAVLGVETEGAPKMHASFAAGHPIHLPSLNTIATSLASKTITPQLFHWKNNWNLLTALASENHTALTIQKFLDHHLTLVEAACAASLSIAYFSPERLANFNSIVFIVCGGIGINLQILNSYLHNL